MERDRIRALLLQVWGEQACRKPSEWPDTLKRLMAPGGDGLTRRSSFRPYVDAAVISIGTQLDAGERLTSDDVWRAFSKLDHRHSERLAGLLNGAAR